MRRLAQSGIAILLVTHHLSDIIPEIDRVVMMKGGQIVADGPRAELLTKGPSSIYSAYPSIWESATGTCMPGSTTRAKS
jgi:ABC-type multidrug transport system ATPase subunit